MNFFNFDLKKAILLAFVVLLPLLSINMERNPSNRGWYGRPFSFLASGASNTFFAFSQGVRGTTALYLNLIDVKKNNGELRNENAELKTKLTSMTELKLENERLNQLLDFNHKNKMDLKAARVIGGDLMTDHHTIQINRGTHHGLKAGQAVIAVGGVVGYVFKPDIFTSLVLLITDRYAVVDAVVQRSRARGVVEGKSSSSCLLRYVEKAADVQPGDLVVTSGLDNIFPKGFPVATVDQVNSTPSNVSLKVELSPVVDPNKIEEVFVVLNANEQDLTPPPAPAEAAEIKADAPATAAAPATPPVKAHQ